MAKTIPTLDLMFLLTESADSPKHVGALLTFTLPAKGDASAVRKLVDEYRRSAPIAPFNYVPELSLKGLPRWKVADSVDMNYHVAHLALPAGSGEDRLIDRVCDLHETVIDRNRPLFRVYFIEGLPGNRFAVYLKIHHAIIDGQSAVMRIVASLSEAAGAKASAPFYAVDMATPRLKPPKGFLQKLTGMQSQVRRQGLAFKDLYVGIVKKGLGSLLRTEPSGSVPFTAPRTPMNEPIRTQRSFAMLSLPLSEMRAVGKVFGGTLNDVTAAVVDDGFHRYLGERHKRVTRPLVAMCPMSLRKPGDTEATTKATLMAVPLGTPSALPRARLEQIIARMGSAKKELRAMPTDTAMLYGISTFALAELAESTPVATKPAANFALSNVPGGKTLLYLGSARLTGMFPVSALGAGIGTNVTLISYADSMDFGIVANGQSMPNLGRLAHHTQAAFGELKAAAATAMREQSKAEAGRPRPRTARAVSG